ncbi:MULTISPECIES: DUF4097 family beta strand repeat-containing protein [Nocardiopsis]|uniref:DUF4097 domain-containing protein n=1 Tax=Nocardiopsis sinuspersici TaxID=501010 RepID=A0A1V3BZM8_9ACTN|nr:MULTISPECIES: DUF4097 family beta strand repeat-containing protein [Nocardiopsis]OOC53898.1 hypothetical protein NOSIN_08865 [Nocardiopsis sinuspersici]
MTFKARGLYASSSKEPRRFRVGPWLLLGAVLVAALVVATAFSVLGSVGVDHGDRSDTYDAPQSMEIENSTGGDVTLTGGDEGVRLDRTLRGTPLTEPEEDIETSGDALQVEALCLGVPFLGGCRVDYEVAVPEGTAVTVETVSGRISVENVHGELNLTSTSGQVRVDDTSGDVTAESTSGRIDVTGARGSLVAETTSGRITAEGEGESLQASSTSGHVDVSGFDARTVTAESTSGGVQVGGDFTEARVSTVSGSIGVTTEDTFDLLSMESVSGGIHVQVPEGVYEVTGESASGSRHVGVETSSGADARIEADTVSGTLSVTSD